MVVPKYVSSFVPALLLVCAGLSTLSFATRAQVRAGTEVHETWTQEFTLAAPTTRNYIPVKDEVKADLDKGLTFVGSGVVQVRSATVQITPKTVSWSRNKTSYRAPGARMVADVTWATPADARDGDRGDVRIRFPKLRGIPSYTYGLHSGGYQRTADGRTVFRETTAHRSDAAVALARMLYVLSVGLPMTILLHSLWWGWRLRREKKARLAELQPPDPQALPRVFYPNPIAEWTAWTLALCIFGGIGSLLGCIAIFETFLYTSMDRALLVIEAVGFVIASIVALIVRASLVTVRIDAHGIGYARGRRAEPNWITARWSDLRGAEFKSRTYKGQTSRWLELGFPDGRTRKIPANVIDFPTLQDMVLDRYARHH
jgi:hypothetical protein